MRLENFEQLNQAVIDADLVLVGLGEEWVLDEEDILKDLSGKNNVLYEMFLYAKKDERFRKLCSFFIAYYYDEYIPDILKNAYKNLLKILEGKNYFIVSLTVDSYLKKMGFKEGRYVNPCGTYEKMQCEEGCDKKLVSSYGLVNEIKTMLNSADCMGQGIEKLLEQCLELVSRYQCESCAADLNFNLLDTKKYLEEGYLEQWQIYMKWLQGTLNKNLCVIEAGVGMKLPSVIRWPFEKTVFYNQKANMFRIHEKFYQVNEEVAERAYGCKCHSVKMFGEKNVEA